MKKFVLFLMCFQVLQSCAQNQKETTMTKEQRIDFLKKKIETHTNQPIFYIDYYTHNSSEVYVNDVLVYANFTDATGAIRIPMNDAILKSGEQKVKVVLYPPIDKDGKMGESLPLDSYLELKVTEREWKNDELMDKDLVINYNIKEDPALNREADFSQKKSWVKEFNLRVSVPYELKGWSESENLVELNKKSPIKPKVEAAFRAIWEEWKNQNADAIDTRELIKQSEINIYDYRDAAYVDRQQNALQNAFEEEQGTSEMLPLEHYEMYIMGDGKLVTLLRTDRENKMEQVIRIKKSNQKGEYEGTNWYNYFLHIPKGKTEFEVIR